MKAWSGGTVKEGRHQERKLVGQGQGRSSVEAEAPAAGEQAGRARRARKTGGGIMGGVLNQVKTCWRGAACSARCATGRSDQAEGKTQGEGARTGLHGTRDQSREKTVQTVGLDRTGCRHHSAK